MPIKEDEKPLSVWRKWRKMHFLRSHAAPWERTLVTSAQIEPTVLKQIMKSAHNASKSQVCAEEMRADICCDSHLLCFLFPSATN